jgi:hypothetical protein
MASFPGVRSFTGSRATLPHRIVVAIPDRDVYAGAIVVADPNDEMAAKDVRAASVGPEQLARADDATRHLETLEALQSEIETYRTSPRGSS